MFVNDYERTQARHTAIGLGLGVLSYMLDLLLLIAILTPLLYWSAVIGYEVWRNNRQERWYWKRDN